MDHSSLNAKFSKASPSATPGDSEYECTFDMVKSGSKLIVSISDLSIGMNGGFNFLFSKALKFIFSNHG
jgi:hypothetical protein